MGKHYEFEGLTIAVTNVEAMLQFYGKVFQIDFVPQQMYGSTLYSGVWGNLKVLFCPAVLAQNTATQNRQQFDFLVHNLDRMVDLAMNNGGRLMGAIQESQGQRSAGIVDPDGNSMVFKEATG